MPNSASDFVKGTLGRVIESESMMNVPTLTTAEEELSRVRIPPHLFQDRSAYGVEFEFIVECAANATSKTVRARINSLAGTVMASHVDTNSGNVIFLTGKLIPIRNTLITGVGITARVVSTTFVFGFVPPTVNFDLEIPLLVTGDSAAAGNLTLRSKRLITLFNH